MTVPHRANGTIKRLLRALSLLTLFAVSFGFAVATQAAPLRQAVPNVDWGDAPDNGTTFRYKTLAANNGASHEIDTRVYLGQWVEFDVDGQPHITALGDDRLDGTDDEDGVSFVALQPGVAGRMRVNASVPGYLSLWVDFNNDGDWDDAGEEAILDRTIPAGTTTQRFAVPNELNPGENGSTYARVRFTTELLQRNLEPPYYSGRVKNGEVEDYRVAVRSDLKDPFEPNDGIDTAIPLGRSRQERDGLSLDSRFDKDWFSWMPDGDGLAFFNTKFLGDGSVRIRLFDANGEPLAEGTSNGNEGGFEHAVSADKLYYLQIEPLSGLLRDYTLQVFPFWTCENYVVLYAGGGSSSDNHLRYYNNIKAMYEMVVDNYGVDPGNVWILYADGTNSAIDLSNGTNSDMTYATSEGANVMAGNNANLQTLLTSTLPGIITSNDHLLFYGFDHGGGSLNSATTGEENITGYGGSTSDDNLESWLSALSYRRRVNVHTQCFAGGMIDDMLPTAANEYGIAATNHYEYSWGDGFAAAFVAALGAGKDDTYDAYKYAHDNDPYAVTRGTYTDNGGTPANSKEHPWATGTSNRPIFCTAPRPWWLDIIWVHRFLPPWEEVIIPFDMLLAHTQGFAPDLGTLQFRIEDVALGELLKDGKPIVPGETTLGYGESLVWRTPANVRVNSDLLPFSVRLSNGGTISDNALPVPIRLEQGRAPMAVDDTFGVDEDAGGVVLKVLDNDGGEGALTVIGVGQPSAGTVAIVNGEVVYTPAANYNGDDSFTYVMSDSSFETDSATVRIKTDFVNDPPEVNPDTVNVVKNGALVGIEPLVNDFDNDLHIMTATLATGRAANGQVFDNGDNTFDYLPNPNFVGQDSFDYVVSDGFVSVQGTVTVNVTAASNLDWGDAPQFPGQYGMGYRTTMERQGARHIVGGPWLGDADDAPDVEADGIPTADARGDNDTIKGDENGVRVVQSFVIGGEGKLEIIVSNASPTAVIDAWIDWDQDLQWGNSDRILAETVGNGTHLFTFNVPAGATPGTTYARFRISTSGGLSQTGQAPNGEVEDHQIILYTAAPTAIATNQVMTGGTLLPVALVFVALALAGGALMLLRRRA